VRFFASRVYGGVLTQSRKEQFAAIAQRAFSQFINERINDRLKSAINNGDAPAVSVTQLPVSEPPEPPSPGRDDLVETTSDELEGYYIVKSLLRDAVDPARITHRDTQSYMGILLDDNNRKPLARLHFNRTQKYLGLFDEQRNEERIAIADLNEIYAHADKLRRVLAFYEGGGEGSQKAE
jgi:hypothetical protein